MTITNQTRKVEHVTLGSYGSLYFMRTAKRVGRGAETVTWRVRPLSSNSTRWSVPTRATEANLEETYSTLQHA